MKTFVGNKLRLLRREHGHTQAQMAESLGVSPAYINQIENNQRTLSLRILIGLLEEYGVDWHDILNDDDERTLIELKSALNDPIFDDNSISARELQTVADSAPQFASSFIKLLNDHRQLVDVMTRLGSEGMPTSVIKVSSEALIHDFFRDNLNHFPKLEHAAETLTQSFPSETESQYLFICERLKRKHDIKVKIKQVEMMGDTLRIFNREKKEIWLSEAFDSINRKFQLLHLICLIEEETLLDKIILDMGEQSPLTINRCKVELANYFAAAALMPYEDFLSMAENVAYDIDRLAIRFGVSVEQVCHRLTTLQRNGRRGIPFFFLRIDKAGNVTKRFNATAFQIAQYGGACPVWNLHTAFRTPGVIIPQFVEMTDGERFFTLSRTTERPTHSSETQDRRLVMSLGCKVEHAEKLSYANPLAPREKRVFAKIGINCHLCPREGCSQRAHQPMVKELNFDPSRRGNTRYDA